MTVFRLCEECVAFFAQLFCIYRKNASHLSHDWKTTVRIPFSCIKIHKIERVGEEMKGRKNKWKFIRKTHILRLKFIYTSNGVWALIIGWSAGCYFLMVSFTDAFCSAS